MGTSPCPFLFNVEDDLNRIHQSLDKLHDKIDENTKTLIINTEDLKHHINRTNLLQTEVEKAEDKIASIEKTIFNFVTPFLFLKKTLIVIGIIAAIAGTVYRFL